MPAARRRDVRKTGQFGQECGDDLDLDGQADDDLGAALVPLNEQIGDFELEPGAPGLVAQLTADIC